MNELEIIIDSLSITGHGIAQHSKLGTLYILGAFPGDEIKVKIYKKIHDISYAQIVSFTTYSQLRESRPTEMPFFSANTPWQHLSIAAENEFKQSFVSSLYKKHTRNLVVSKMAEIPSTGYRNKVAYSFMNTKKETLCFALYTRGIGGSSKKPQEENILVHPLLEKVGKQFLHFFNQKQIKQEDLKYLNLRYSYLENKVVAQILVPETSRKKLPFKKSELETFISNSTDLKGILVSHSEPFTRSSATTKDFYEIGDIVISEELLDKTYLYHPSLFFQIYPKAFSEILIDIKEQVLAIPNNKDIPVLDMFAGVGVIGLEIADSVSFVTGIELSTLSKEYALRNARLNNISNFDFIESSVDNILEHIQSQHILIVDPTRAGLSKGMLEKIKEQKPSVYFLYIVQSRNAV